MMHHRTLLALFVAASALVPPVLAQAQTSPASPTDMYVPSGAGKPVAEPAQPRKSPPLDNIRLEAEDMQCATGAWAPATHEKYAGYYRYPSQLKYLKGIAGTAGSASITATVKQAGAYRIWVRNQDVPSDVYTLKVTQGGKTVAEATFNEKTPRAPEKEDVGTGWASGASLFTWWHVDATLQPGPCTLEVTKDAAVTVNVLDCFVFTTDRTYAPQISDLNPPLYVRAVLGPKHNKTGGALYFRGRVDRPPFLTPHGFITNRGYAEPEGFNNITPEMLLHAGEATPWVNIAPLLDQREFNRMHFAMMPTWYKFLPDAEFTIELASRPTAKPIRRFHRSGKGAGIAVLIDVLHPENSYSSIEGSARDLKRARAIPTPKWGKQPTKFPLLSGLVDMETLDPEIVIQTDIKTIRELGMTGTDCEYRNGRWLKQQGILYTSYGSGGFHLTKERFCFSQPLVPDIRQAFVEAVRDHERPEQKTVYVKLMDEYFSVDLDPKGGWHSMLGCPACENKLRDYLKQRGLTPADLLPDFKAEPGKDPWAAIKPTTDKSLGKLYYYSMIVRGRIGVEFFKLFTDIANELKPGLRTAANTSLEFTWWRNMMARGNDLFAMYKEGGLSCGHAEDCNSAPPSPQTSCFIMDVLRSACKYRKLPFGTYNVCFTGYGFDLVAKAIAEVGHGCQFIHFYDYGPFHGVASDPQSQRQDFIEALKEASYVIGAAEDDLIGSVPAPTKVALIYSQSTDIWTSVEDPSNMSNSGTERVDLYLLLRHLGYPIDIITEDDILDGYAKQYEAIFLTESHLKDGVMPKLIDWMKQGGQLYATAGAARFNHFNQPIGDLEGIGLKRGEFVFKGAYFYFPHTLGVEAKVAWNGATIDAAGGYQKVAADSAGTVALKFDDGSPCATAIPFGKGSLTYIGFFPGTSYVRGASIPELKREEETAAAGKQHISLSSTFYQPEYRQLMQLLLKPLKFTPVLRVNNPLVEGCLLVSERNHVVTLANWTGAKKKVTVSVDLPYASGMLRAATYRIKKVQRQGNTVTFTMEVGSGDIIVLPRKK